MAETPEDPNPTTPAQQFAMLMAEANSEISAAMMAGLAMPTATPVSVGSTVFMVVYNNMAAEMGFDNAAVALLQAFERLHEKPMSMFDINRTKTTLENMAEARRAANRASAKLIGPDGEALGRGH